MKRRELERHLRAHGAQRLREGGNHSFWGFDAERSSAVPRHRELDFRLVRERPSGWSATRLRAENVTRRRKRLAVRQPTGVWYA